MTISSTKQFLSFIGLLLMNPLWAQEDFTGYVEPSISLNYKVSQNYKHNFSLSSRNYFYTDETYQLQARQLDIVHFSNLKIRSNQDIAFGIQYRFRDNFEPGKGNELRLTQQYNIVFKPKNTRFGHRFRNEQRINLSLVTFRLRYRFALDFPLQGEQLDIGEAYVVCSTESLLSMAKTRLPQYDHRFTANIGWLLGKHTKLQTGLQYRFENYTHYTEKVFFVLTSLVLSL